MRIAIGLGLLLASAGIATADCTPLYNADGQTKAYQCDLPVAPQGPPHCNLVSGLLICTGEIGQETERTNIVKPANCGWRRGRYVCW